MPSLRQRIESKFIPEPNSGCFLWLGYLNDKGYAKIRIGNQLQFVHRVYYEMERGPIPAGTVTDHLCKVKCCVNPAHLEMVTSQVNGQRAGRPRQFYCLQGHEFTPENTGVYARSSRKGYYRRCKICFNAWQRKRKQKERETML
jgi:hypothetical protein